MGQVFSITTMSDVDSTATTVPVTEAPASVAETTASDPIVTTKDTEAPAEVAPNSPCTDLNHEECSLSNTSTFPVPLQDKPAVEATTAPVKLDEVSSATVEVTEEKGVENKTTEEKVTEEKVTEEKNTEAVTSKDEASDENKDPVADIPVNEAVAETASTVGEKRSADEAVATEESKAEQSPPKKAAEEPEAANTEA